MIKAKVLKLVFLISLFTIVSKAHYANIFSPGSAGWMDEPICNNQAYQLGEKIDHAIKLNDLISQIRALPYSNSNSCSKTRMVRKNKPDKNQENYRDMPSLISSLVDINEETAKFFSTTLSDKVDTLASLLYQNTNYCSKDFPSDEKLRSLQKDINISMNNDIRSIMKNLKL